MFSNVLYCPVALDATYLCDIDVLTVGGNLTFSAEANTTTPNAPTFDTFANPGSITFVTNTQASWEAAHRKPITLVVSFTDAWTRVRFPMWAIGAIATGGLLLLILVAYAISCCCRERHTYARFN